ncbi:MAG TPA: tripartite tricarboxylate transporter substrate binding protein [Thermodesulfobacteriota bacterium]|nr:tripartite tricarboxylate transporter substrate binding protein [Thermodesulfobacteriota bacterium]
MRRFYRATMLSLVLLGLTLTGNKVHAQPYPGRPLQLIIPNVPGSIMDINSRILSEDLGKILGTQIIPMNKPGAATILGTDTLAKSKKDGYTVGYVSNSIVYARILNPETMHFDPDKDIEPLGLHLIVPLAVAVRADAPWKTFNELLDDAKKNPGKLRVDTIGIGSPAHFNLEIIQSLTGAQFTHVPFKGGESVITALLGGHLEMTYDAINKIYPHVESGKLRILLLTYKMADFPNVPTIADLGYKQELVSTWFAMYSPSGLPEEVKRVLVPAVEKAIRNPESKAKVEQMKFIVDYKSPEEMKKRVVAEYNRAVQIADKVGLRKKN